MNHIDSFIDLHMHSNCSDGVLSPAELVDKVADCDVKVFSLTDHDSLDGLAAAREAAQAHNLTLIPGIEISTSFEHTGLHVVGLQVDIDNPALRQASQSLRELRQTRAERMARKLDKLGAQHSLRDAAALAGDGMITRTHFARVLIDQGMARDMKQVFKRFLGQGKPGFVGVEWAALDEAIDWIRQAGGRAVLAHPLRYKLTASKLRRILEAFKAAGGEGMEVVCGTHTPDETRHCAGLAARHGFLGSVGSDFHGIGNPYIQPGRLHALPESVQPVWHDWDLPEPLH